MIDWLYVSAFLYGAGAALLLDYADTVGDYSKPAKAFAAIVWPVIAFLLTVLGWAILAYRAWRVVRDRVSPDALDEPRQLKKGNSLPFLTVEQYAIIHGMSEQTVRRKCKSGEIKTQPGCRPYRIDAKYS